MIFSIHVYRKDFEILKEVCKNCNSCSTFSTRREKHILNFFFIPLFSYKTNYFLVCDHCSNKFKITLNEYMNLIYYKKGRGDINIEDIIKGVRGKTVTQMNYLNEVRKIKKEKLLKSIRKRKD